MQVRYENAELQKMYEDPSYRSKRWNRDIIKAYRKVMQWIIDADHETDLYALKSLRYEKLKADRVGQRSLRLNDQFRLIVKLETQQSRIVFIVEIVDYH